VQVAEIKSLSAVLNIKIIIPITTARPTIKNPTFLFFMLFAITPLLQSQSSSQPQPNLLLFSDEK